jgi:hypothetical protein
MSDKPKSKKQKAAEAADAPGVVTVALTNLIHVRLVPQQSKANAETDGRDHSPTYN